jgi:hypothetical protein
LYTDATEFTDKHGFFIFRKYLDNVTFGAGVRKFYLRTVYPEVACPGGLSRELLDSSKKVNVTLSKYSKLPPIKDKLLAANYADLCEYLKNSRELAKFAEKN